MSDVKKSGSVNHRLTSTWFCAVVFGTQVVCAQVSSVVMLAFSDLSYSPLPSFPVYLEVSLYMHRSLLYKRDLSIGLFCTYIGLFCSGARYGPALRPGQTHTHTHTQVPETSADSVCYHSSSLCLFAPST